MLKLVKFGGKFQENSNSSFSKTFISLLSDSTLNHDATTYDNPIFGHSSGFHQNHNTDNRWGEKGFGQFYSFETNDDSWQNKRFIQCGIETKYQQQSKKATEVISRWFFFFNSFTFIFQEVPDNWGIVIIFSSGDSDQQKARHLHRASSPSSAIVQSKARDFRSLILIWPLIRVV